MQADTACISLATRRHISDQDIHLVRSRLGESLDQTLLQPEEVHWDLRRCKHDPGEPDREREERVDSQYLFLKGVIYSVSRSSAVSISTRGENDRPDEIPHRPTGTST